VLDCFFRAQGNGGVARRARLPAISRFRLRPLLVGAGGVVLGRVLRLRVVCLRNGCFAAPSGFDTAVPCARQLQFSVRLWESDYVPALARSCDFRTVQDSDNPYRP
jgi:hypothetical protein